MKPGIYKHVRNKDVAMKIDKVIPYDDGLSVIVLWINIVNPKNNYIIDEIHQVEFITNEELPNWEPYENL